VREAEIHDICREYKHVLVPVKGVADRDYIVRTRTVNKHNAKRRTKGAVEGVDVNTHRLKYRLLGLISNPPTRGRWWIPKDIRSEWRRQMTSEYPAVTRNKNGVQKTTWERRKGIPNHYLDSKVYAMAAAELKGLRARLTDTTASERKVRKRQEQELRAEITGRERQKIEKRREQWMGRGRGGWMSK
jgi:phage terminase large subunit GpA-like protein